MKQNSEQKILKYTQKCRIIIKKIHESVGRMYGGARIRAFS